MDSLEALREELTLVVSDADFSESVELDVTALDRGALVKLDGMTYVVDPSWAKGNLGRLPDHPSKRQVHEALRLSDPSVRGVSSKYRERNP